MTTTLLSIGYCVVEPNKEWPSLLLHLCWLHRVVLSRGRQGQSFFSLPEGIARSLTVSC